jgi:hypothetical protein
MLRVFLNTLNFAKTRKPILLLATTPYFISPAKYLLSNIHFFLSLAFVVFTFVTGRVG